MSWLDILNDKMTRGGENLCFHPLIFSNTLWDLAYQLNINIYFLPVSIHLPFSPFHLEGHHESLNLS